MHAHMQRHDTALGLDTGQHGDDSSHGSMTPSSSNNTSKQSRTKHSPRTLSSSARKSMFGQPRSNKHLKRTNSSEIPQQLLPLPSAADNPLSLDATKPSSSTIPDGTSQQTTSADGVANGTSSITSPPIRRRWLRYPIRVPLIALLLVSLLARSSDGWTSIGGFVCGFLLFEGVSAPETGQPNRCDKWMRALMRKIGVWRRNRRTRRHRRRLLLRQVHEEHEQISKLGSFVLCFRVPFLWCFRSCIPTRLLQRRRSTRNNNRRTIDPSQSEQSGEESRDRTTMDRDRDPQPAAEEDTDVLMDVSLSLVEEEADDRNKTNTTDASSSPTPITAATASATPAQSASGTPSSSIPSTPRPSLTDSLSLPTVSALDASDLVDDAHLTGDRRPSQAIVGGQAHWHNYSVSLRFTIYNFHFHLHHWLYLLIIFLFLYMEQVYWSAHAASNSIYSFASAFCLGGSVQGLKYRDWARVIWRKTKEKIREIEEEHHLIQRTHTDETTDTATAATDLSHNFHTNDQRNNHSSHGPSASDLESGERIGLLASNNSERTHQHGHDSLKSALRNDMIMATRREQRGTGPGSGIAAAAGSEQINSDQLRQALSADSSDT